MKSRSALSLSFGSRRSLRGARLASLVRVAVAVRLRGCCCLGGRLSRLTAKTNLPGHFATYLRITLRDHWVVGLEAEPFTILGGGQAVSRQVPLERLVRLAIDHRDDVILGSQRLTNAHCR